VTAPGAVWRPTAGPETLRARAQALAKAREFFAERGVMEVETPLIVAQPASDPQLANVSCRLSLQPTREYFLHTSPEYHMKRLLAAGAPDIYQIGKVFRDGEIGPRHLPEFTLIEWYRRTVDYDAFIREVTELVGAICTTLGKSAPIPARHSYAQLFGQFAGVDPLDTDARGLQELAKALLGPRLTDSLQRGLEGDRAAWLDLLMVEVIEPRLRGMGLVVVDRYPAEQAALATLDPRDARVARRFEVYLDGIELANGYHELCDAAEQERRFSADRQRRRRLGLPDVRPDKMLLEALRSGLPDCCGVALGFDRLVMTCLGLRQIHEAVSFAPGENC